MLKQPICFSCKHFYPTNEAGDIKCKAFPEVIKRESDWVPSAIPLEIFRGEFDHTKPYPGDNGIRYEPIDE